MSDNPNGIKNLDESTTTGEPRTPSPSVYLNASVNDVIENNQCMMEYTNIKESEEIINERPIKRNREEEDVEWELVKKDKKTKMNSLDNMEVYVTSKEKLPKQFALARLFKDIGILDIKKIKYLNPYKIRLDFDNELSMEKCITCKQLIDKGWNFQKSLQVTYTYGTIRDVDMDLSDEEIKNSIKCDSRAPLTSVFRLKRRNSNGEWTLSETVRLTFKGSFLPSHVYVDDLRIKVEPFVFPVSQCSKCWKLGHTRSRCPSEKPTCPKCSGKHENCDTQIYVCVNCQGDHMALNKSACPKVIKEKRIRELMSEFNCTYRQARSLYVPKSPGEENPKIIQQPYSFPKPSHSEHTDVLSYSNMFSPLSEQKTNESKKEHPFTPTYASVLQVQADVHADMIHSKRGETSKAKKKLNKDTSKLNTKHKSNLLESQTHNEDSYEEDFRDIKPGSRLKRDVTFGELLRRLKEIIFTKSDSIQQKIKSVMKCCIEWLILITVENIAEWPILKLILEYVS